MLIIQIISYCSRYNDSNYITRMLINNRCQQWSDDIGCCKRKTPYTFGHSIIGIKPVGYDFEV